MSLALFQLWIKNNLLSIDPVETCGNESGERPFFEFFNGSFYASRMNLTFAVYFTGLILS